MDTDLKHWILSSPKLLGNDVAGLRAPDAACALVVDGYSTANGKTFDFPPFGAGRCAATFMVLPAEAGHRVYERLAAYVGSRRSLIDNLADENEVLAARWDLPDGQVAVMAAESGGVENAQDAFERFLALDKIPLHSSNLAVIAPRFDASQLLAARTSVFSKEAAEALRALLPAAKPAPRSRAPKAG